MYLKIMNIFLSCAVKQLRNLPALCKKLLLAAEHKMQLAYYLRNTDWFRRCSEFGFFDESLIILFTIFY